MVGGKEKKSCYNSSDERGEVEGKYSRAGNALNLARDFPVCFRRALLLPATAHNFFACRHPRTY
jgi:hypothetical protein